MPLPSRIAIRLALGWLFIGMALGVMVAASRSGLGPVAWFRGLDVHIGALLVGWFAQFVVAVAFWMLPKHPTEHPRGNERVFLGGVLLLNLGLLVRSVLLLAAATAWVPVATAAVPVAFGVCATQLWPRVKPFSDSIRSPGS